MVTLGAPREHLQPGRVVDFSRRGLKLPDALSRASIRDVVDGCRGKCVSLSELRTVVRRFDEAHVPTVPVPTPAPILQPIPAVQSPPTAPPPPISWRKKVLDISHIEQMQVLEADVPDLQEKDLHDLLRQYRFDGDYLRVYFRQACALPPLSKEQEKEIGHSMIGYRDAWRAEILSRPFVHTLVRAKFLTYKMDPRANRLFKNTLSKELTAAAVAEIDGILRALKDLPGDASSDAAIDILERVPMRDSVIVEFEHSLKKQLSAVQKMSADEQLHFLLESQENALKSLAEADRMETRWHADRQKLAAHNTRLVVAIAKKYRRKTIPFLDLIQEGNSGLMHATELWEPDFGDGSLKFSTYATWWIKQSVKRAASEDKLIHRGDHKNPYYLKLKQAEERYLKSHQRKPSMETLAELTGMPVNDVRDLLRSTISASTPLGTDTDNELMDMIEDQSVPDSSVDTERHALRSAIDVALRSLTYREREIIKMRYSLGDGYSYTLEQCAKVFRVTRERVRQLESKAFKKLQGDKRAPLLRKFLDPFGGEEAESGSRRKR